MKQTELAGKAQTVLGVVDGEKLGITSTHEHIIWDMSTYFEEPEGATDRGLARQPVSMENSARKDWGETRSPWLVFPEPRD